MDNTKVKKQIRKFEEHLIVDRGLSKETAEGYGRSMNIALRRMRKFKPKYEHIRTHILWMHEKKYSYSHIVNTSLAIERYTEYKGTPVKIGRPEKPRRIIKNTLSEAEISLLLSATKNDIRKKAMFALLAYSGMRCKELCGLKVGDVDLGENMVHILGGKNNKDRLVNVSSACVRVLIEYLKEYPRERDSYLFTTLRHNNPYGRQDLRKALRVTAAKANIKTKVNPHNFRHSLATNLLKRGAGLMLIKNQLGHAFIESTMIYTHSSPFGSKSEYDHFKPAYM